MTALGTVGTLVQVTPGDDVQYWSDPDSDWQFIDDWTPFIFRVEGWLEDGHIRYGLYGPVVDGPQRYQNLICSIIVRDDGSDWRVDTDGSAGFRVGPAIVTRDHRHDFRHPEGTVMVGYPRMSRFGYLQVLDT